jgi:hypothetical protein
MANLIPAGIDATTGQKKELTSSDTLVDASGAALSRSVVVAGDGIAAATTGGALQDLKTYTFPAASLAVGDQVVLEGWGTNEGTAENGDIFCYFGGSGGDFIGPSVEGGPGGHWSFKIWISITGAATQTTYSLAHLGTDAAPNSDTHRTERHSATQALSGSIELLVRGSNIDGTSDNAVIIRGWSVTHTINT